MEFYIISLIGLAALIHASFQLSLSVLTLLSGHAISRKTSQRKLLALTGSFIAGVALTTALVVASTTWLMHGLQRTFQSDLPLWAATIGLSIGLTVAVWGFYFRKQPGTSLWLPRGLARYLHSRIKATKLNAEAFGLGMVSVIAEIIFILPSTLAASIGLNQIQPMYQLWFFLGYITLSLLPLLAIGSNINAGIKISRIQRWREDNKRFIQITTGLGLLIMATYIYALFIAGKGIL